MTLRPHAVQNIVVLNAVKLTIQESQNDVHCQNGGRECGGFYVTSVGTKNYARTIMCHKCRARIDKIVSLFTAWHHSANLEIPNSDQLGIFVYLYLPCM